MFKRSSVFRNNYQRIVKSKIAQIESYLNEDNVNVGEDEITLKVVMDCYSRWLKGQRKLKYNYEEIFCKGPYYNEYAHISMENNNTLCICCSYDKERIDLGSNRPYSKYRDYLIKMIKNPNGEMDFMVAGDNDYTKKLLLTEPRLKEIVDFIKQYTWFTENTWQIFRNECFDVYLSANGMVVECYSSRIKVFSMTIDMYGNVNYDTDFTYVGMFLKNNKSKILLDVVVKISDCPSCISDELRRMRHPELVFED